MVMVTSAEAGDGTTLTAASLAECLARAGRSTALLTLDTNENEPEPESRASLMGGPLKHAMPKYLAIPDESAALSREELRSFVDSVRESYDFLIVDAPALLESHRAIALSEFADGILFSVRLGRTVTENDKIALEIIEQSQRKILGVVAVGSDAIAQFARGSKAQLELPGRKAATAPAPRRRGFMHGWANKAIAAVVTLTVLLASVVAFAELQPERYNSLAIMPAPAKAVVSHIVGTLKLPQKL